MKPIQINLTPAGDDAFDLTIGKYRCTISDGQANRIGSALMKYRWCKQPFTLYFDEMCEELYEPPADPDIDFATWSVDNCILTIDDCGDAESWRLPWKDLVKLGVWLRGVGRPVDGWFPADHDWPVEVRPMSKAMHGLEVALWMQE